MSENAMSGEATSGHRPWVRICHWSIASIVLTLAVTGFVILMAHPRLYWGETGNDMTPAWIELPISRNYQHGGWAEPETFGRVPNRAVSAVRTYDIFNQNSWGRSLHFLAAWGLVTFGLAYGLVALITGHLRKNLLPGAGGLMAKAILADLLAHLRGSSPSSPSRPGPPYNILQRWAYFLVLFGCLPVMVLTGLTMSPAVTAAYPWLLDLFGGFQSARSLHFLTFLSILLFVLVHVGMVVRTGFWQQIKAMIVGH